VGSRFCQSAVSRLAIELQLELAPLRSDAQLHNACKQSVSLAIRSGDIDAPLSRARTAQKLLLR